jgi:hypothetical protein
MCPATTLRTASLSIWTALPGPVNHDFMSNVSVWWYSRGCHMGVYWGLRIVYLSLAAGGEGGPQGTALSQYSLHLLTPWINIRTVLSSFWAFVSQACHGVGCLGRRVRRLSLAAGGEGGPQRTAVSIYIAFDDPLDQDQLCFTGFWPPVLHTCHMGCCLGCRVSGLSLAAGGEGGPQRAALSVHLHRL